MVKTLSKKRRNGNTKNDKTVGRTYQVEAILDKRIRGKKTQYLLKWKGYSNADNSWEDESRLNCPDLFKDFEERLKEQSKTKKSTSKQSKNTNMEDTDEDYQSIEDQSSSTTTESGTESATIDDDDDDEEGNPDRIMTRQSPRKKVRLSSPKSNSSPTKRRHSNRASIPQTKSRISSMSKDDSSNDDTMEEEEEEESSPPPIKRSKKPALVTRKASDDVSIIADDDENNHNNNNSIEISGKNSIKKPDTNRPKTRFRLTPALASSISFSTNANEHGSDKTSMENSSEMMDETDQVEQIQTVRCCRNEISFRIKLINENEARWIPSKIANRKYSQAVIAFWESHVEFT